MHEIGLVETMIYQPGDDEVSLKQQENPWIDLLLELHSAIIYFFWKSWWLCTNNKKYDVFIRNYWSVTISLVGFSSRHCEKSWENGSHRYYTVSWEMIQKSIKIACSFNLTTFYNDNLLENVDLAHLFVMLLLKSCWLTIIN
jgi:hypothetical protein